MIGKPWVFRSFLYVYLGLNHHSLQGSSLDLRCSRLLTCPGFAMALKPVTWRKTPPIHWKLPKNLESYHKHPPRNHKNPEYPQTNPSKSIRHPSDIHGKIHQNPQVFLPRNHGSARERRRAWGDGGLQRQRLCEVHPDGEWLGGIPMAHPGRKWGAEQI